VLLRIKLALNRRPMGRIERTNISLEIWMSFAPSRRWVVRCKTRVPMAYRESDAFKTSRSGAYGEGEMPCNKEDGVTEVERAVQVVVVQDDRGRENDPNGDDSGGRDLWLGSGNLGGDWGGQIAVGFLLAGHGLISWLDERLLFELAVGRLLGGHG